VKTRSAPAWHTVTSSPSTDAINADCGPQLRTSVGGKWNGEQCLTFFQNFLGSVMGLTEFKYVPWFRSEHSKVCFFFPF
jgi:hypothetical protein